MPLVQTRGAASAQGFGEFAQATAVNYIEEVFSTYLYTGNGTAQTITNGIDLAGKGGLVWVKNRNQTNFSHRLIDTVRGGANYLESNNTDAQGNYSGNITSFNSTGFSAGDANFVNSASNTFVSWTFREQPKFFDVVTYTGTGSNATIAHSLGSVPGSIIVKRTDTTAAWAVYHRSLANTEYLVLNSTAAKATGATWWNSTTPTSAVFSVGTDASVNASGATYVAYLFAHDAGGFGLSGTDNVISCGSFTTDGSGNVTVSLGYEPQWIVIKKSTDAGDWDILDTMRGWVVGGVDSNLKPNTAAAESAGFDRLNPTATGFVSAAGALSASQTYIYIAIRRGPMKVPTLGTSVFSPVARTGTGATATVTSGFPVSSAWISARPNTVSQGFQVYDRLRGANVRLSPPYTQQEYSTPTNELTGFDSNTSVTLGASTPDRLTNYSGETYINYFFQRAPGFFDQVCYTGTGVARDITHNLGAVPELMFVKWRTGAPANWQWGCYDAPSGPTKYMRLNSSDGNATSSVLWNDTAPTASVFTVGTGVNTNENNTTYVAYLFATCAGVSKVGSYTGNGTTQTINCGFTGGARFVLIKRTDSTGDWYVWDSARGIVAGNDPHLSLNTTAAEVTTDDSVDTDNTGFVVNQLSATDINVTSASYIFLSVA
jgi:hypothetical protein